MVLRMKSYSVEKKTSAENSQSCFKPFLGLTYTILCSVSIMMTSVFVHQLTYISPGQLSLVRNLGVMIGVLPIAVYSRQNILGPKKYRVILFIRGILGATALYLNLLAFRYLPLAEASVIMSTVPALVSVIARFYLKEPCGLVQSFALLLTLTGVLLSIRLPQLLQKGDGHNFSMEYFGGIGSAVLCVLILSFTFVAVRALKEVHFSVVLLYFGVMGVIENATINAVVDVFTWPKCGWDNAQVVLIAVFGFLGHCFLTLAIQAEAVGIVTVLKASLDIVVAIVFQMIFFNSFPDAYNVGGAALVILSVTITGIRKWLLQLPDNSPTKKTWRWLLL